MDVINRFLTPGVNHGRPQTMLVHKGIVIHYVGNPGSSAEANRNWFENGAGGANTSAHYIIGLNGEILQCVPDNECAMHAGKSYGAKWDKQAPKNNALYIGIECCHPDNSGKFNDKTYASLIELCVDLCSRYGFKPLTDIFRHYDVCGKSCPLYYVNNAYEWNNLKDLINHAFIQSIAPSVGLVNIPSDWAAPAWEWMESNGLNDGTRPRAYATREETAAQLYRFWMKYHVK